MKTKTIIVTGNHHTPAIELIKQLKTDKQYHWRIVYIGHFHPATAGHIQKTIISKLQTEFHQLESGKFNRYSLFKTITGLPQTLKAIKTANTLIKKTQPHLVISFGGYVSVPVVIASCLQHIPTITHEQTLTLSLSTVVNGFFVTKIALSFPPPSHSIAKLFHSKITTTGNLLRSQIYQKTTASFSQLKIKNKPLIYITGGSQGALTINQNILPLLTQLSKKFTIIHQTGKTHLTAIKKQTGQLKNYYPTDYIGLDDIGWVLNTALIIISRAGANTSQEIVRLKKKAILVPLPHTQQNEQDKNALWVKKNLPATIIIKQKQLTPSLLLHNIHQLSRLPNQKVQPVKKDNLKILKLIHRLV